MIAGIYRISGAEVFASQLKMLAFSTPSFSATSFWGIFNPNRRFLMWSPTVCGATGMRITRPVLYDWGRAKGIGRSGSLKQYVTVISFCFTPQVSTVSTRMPATRTSIRRRFCSHDTGSSSCFLEIRQERLRGADVRADPVGTGDPAAEFGDLRLQLCLLLGSKV
jgi:hypothetical protein